MPRDVFFSVDIEASGPVPALFNMVSIGAVPVDHRDGAWRPGEERFYVELKPIAPGFDAGAMKVHGIPRQKLEAEGVPAGEAMRRLSEFVAVCLRRTGGRPVFVGHNAAWTAPSRPVDALIVRSTFSCARTLAAPPLV